MSTRQILKRTPLRIPVRWSRYWFRTLIDRDYRRREISLWREYLPWRRRYGGWLPARVNDPNRAGQHEPFPKALVVGKGTANGAKIELGLIKGLELAGYEPVVLTDRSLAKFYRLAGVREFAYWDDYGDRRDGADAAAAVRRSRTSDDLLAIQREGARVGRFAVSTTFRELRAGHLDLASPDARRTLAANLTLSMIHASAACRMLERIRPRLAMFLDNRYSGQAELWDLSVARGIDVITWFEAHRSDTLMLKRYRRENRDQHHASLSPCSWRLVSDMEWTSDHRRALRREIDANYMNGDWYCRGGTQFNKQIVTPERLREQLGLEAGRKTAVIFPHIVWDATLFWGVDLFENYEEWLVETVRAACRNTEVNWIIKIHPANVVKSAWEDFEGEAAEVLAIRKRIGGLPPHVVLIPASSDINTFSLFGLMDFCVTVRGTIGVEAASLGIVALTAGSGRYDRRGFTIDSDTREDYLDKLSRIQDLPPMTSAQRELAERFAYGAFVLRPLSLETISIRYERDREATMRVGLNAAGVDELRNAPDLRAFADWVARSADEDFLDASVALGREWPRSA